MPDIFKMDTPAEPITVANHKAEILLMVEVINAYLAGFNLMGTIHLKDDTQRILVYELIMSFHSLLCACRLSVSGFYTQAIALLRQITENWLVCQTCESNERVRQHILDGEPKRFDYRQLAKSIGVEKTIYADYQMQSKLAHGSNISLGILKEKDTDMLRVFPTYEKLLFLSCCENYFRYAALMLDCMYKLLTSLDKEKAAEWDINTSQVAKKVGKWQKKLRDEYGEQDSNQL